MLMPIASKKPAKCREEAVGQAAAEVGLTYREASGDTGRSLLRRSRQAVAHGKPWP
jgi:hypothetical protein